MQFSLGDVVQLKSESGKPFTAYEMLLDGVFHSFGRYRQFMSLFQELEKMGFQIKCEFPEKSLLKLSPEALLTRRLGLQNFLRVVGSDLNLLTAVPTVRFFVHTREAYLRRQPVFSRNIKIRFPGGVLVPLTLGNIETTDTVLRRLSAVMSITEDIIFAFGLFLIKRVEDTIIFLRKLCRFECPLISLDDASRDSGQYEIWLRKCTFSEEADALLLENESTAGFICKQAIDDLDPTLMSDMQPKLDHLSTSGASIAIRTRAFDTCQTHSDFKKCLHWLQNNAPLYGSQSIHSCKVDFSPASVGLTGKAPDTVARMSDNASLTLRSARVWINRKALTVCLQTASSDAQENAPLILQLPIDCIQSWQVVVPEATELPCPDAPPHILLYHPPGQYLLPSSKYLKDEGITRSTLDSLNNSDAYSRFVIASSSADQIYLLNNSLLSIVDETMRVRRCECPFDSPSSRLPSTHLFPIPPTSTFPPDSPFSSSISSLSEDTEAGQRFENAFKWGANSILRNLRRLVATSRPLNNDNPNFNPATTTGTASTPGNDGYAEGLSQQGNTRFLLIEDAIPAGDGGLGRLELKDQRHTRDTMFSGLQERPMLYNPQDPLSPQPL